jgi:hypothetical protein
MRAKKTERSFTEHIAHIESTKSWKVGDRVIVPLSGRTGVLGKRLGKHNGWVVKWDNPMFGVEQGSCLPGNLELYEAPTERGYEDD